jgi:hypothetical protein
VIALATEEGGLEEVPRGVDRASVRHTTVDVITPAEAMPD